MRGHCGVPHNSPPASYPSRLLPYKHPAPVSPLECALPRCCVNAHSKQLTGSAKSFGMRTYEKTGGGVPSHFRLPAARLLPSLHGRTTKQVYCRDLSSLFLTLTKTAGVYLLSSRSGTP